MPGDPEQLRTLSVTLNEKGDVLKAQGNLAEALKAYKDGLAIRDHLAEADPSNAGWQRNLAVGYGRVAMTLAQQGETAQALSEYRQARDVIARLKEESPDNATLPNDLAWYEAEIAKLEQADAALGNGATGNSVKPIASCR